MLRSNLQLCVKRLLTHFLRPGPDSGRVETKKARGCLCTRGGEGGGITARQRGQGKLPRAPFWAESDLLGASLPKGHVREPQPRVKAPSATLLPWGHRETWSWSGLCSSQAGDFGCSLSGPQFSMAENDGGDCIRVSWTFWFLTLICSMKYILP